MSHLFSIPYKPTLVYLPDKIVQLVVTTLRQIRLLIMVLPPFLTLSPAQKRTRFLEILDACDGHLEEAFSATPDSKWSIQTAVMPQNRLRNRYLNVFPWDRTRVPLHTTGVDSSDYINASWVTLSPKAQYIAAQGPLETTVHHFWAMCFGQAVQNNTDTVVVAMVTPLVEMGREKCFKYWPDENRGTWDFSELMARDRIGPNSLTLAWKSQELHSDGFTVTTLKLQSGDVSKTVLHYYYEQWQDTKVPDSVEPLVALSEEISAVKNLHPTLVPVVHCSAGVGRTGTFIAIDYFRNFADPFDGSHVDPVAEVVTQLRDQRMMMVQTVHQYVFLYDYLMRMYRERKVGVASV